LNLNSNISKQKLLIKNTKIFDWDGHTKEKRIRKLMDINNKTG
jgi:hypothetical protein